MAQRQFYLLVLSGAEYRPARVCRSAWREGGMSHWRRRGRIATRTLLMALVITAVARPALAQERPNSLTLNCAVLTDMVSERGSAVIATGSSLFDRYVANRRFCDASQTIQPARLPTLDQPHCFLGYRCIPLGDSDR